MCNPQGCKQVGFRSVFVKKLSNLRGPSNALHWIEGTWRIRKRVEVRVDPDPNTHGPSRGTWTGQVWASSSWRWNYQHNLLHAELFQALLFNLCWKFQHNLLNTEFPGITTQPVLLKNGQACLDWPKFFFFFSFCLFGRKEPKFVKLTIE